MPDKIFGYLPYIYFCAVSLAALCVTVYDKWASKNRPEGRIRERTLFLWAAFGGSFAMFLTMQAIRHKTRHLSFMIGIPAIMAAQVALIFAIDYFF
ncbi:MAG: DUF1294 domain-containing protein [Clostridia bacterium]|nr:DUF1294 domain-containing protein [Clostridia bacterium]